MILLVTSIERRSECVAALQEATGEPVTIADDLALATNLLRGDTYSVAVFDRLVAETEPNEFETVLQHLGPAIPVQVNLATSGTKRIVREVRCAMRHREYEKIAARQTAQQQLRGELSETLTTILINCELALDSANIPPYALQRIVSVHEAARKLRTQLEAPRV